MRELAFATSSLLIIAALSSPALAQAGPSSPNFEMMRDGKMTMHDGQWMMMMPNNGHMHVMQGDVAMNEMMKQHGKPMPGNMIMKMENGKIMMMEDMKMPDGKTMSEHMATMK